MGFWTALAAFNGFQNGKNGEEPVSSFYYPGNNSEIAVAYREAYEKGAKVLEMKTKGRASNAINNFIDRDDEEE